MNNARITAGIVAGLVSLCAAAECDKPWPVDVPDGEKATKEEMIETQKAIKAYLADADAYLICLEEEGRAVKVDPEDKDAIQEAMEDQAIRTRRHNAMVDEMHMIAERFNRTVRAYRERQPSKVD